jgi:rSAM/selenodomain-associated transferase 1
MKDVVFVFARAPRLGTVKRRLARDIGDRAALRFHRATLARVLRELAADRRFTTVLAQTPDRARIARPRGVAMMPQGGGDLGARMQRILGRARRAAVVGCDIPGLRAADVAAAFQALGRAQACFGPAEDGGYWLVALGPRRPSHPFAGVRWSTPHALADTLANFIDRPVALLRTLRDVDSVADLRAQESTAPTRCVQVGQGPEAFYRLESGLSSCEAAPARVPQDRIG